MFNYKLIGFLQSALSEEKDCDKGWKNEKHQKMKKCMEETRELKACCPFPENESIKDDPECSHHLEGIEAKEKKEKMKAYNCFSECIFTNKNLLVDGELDGAEIKKMTEQYITEANESEFIEISLNSIDYCMNECEII